MSAPPEFDEGTCEIERILRDEERKGHMLTASVEGILEKIAKRRNEGWLVFFVPMIPPAMLALVEIEYTHYPPGTEKNEGFELAQLFNCRDVKRSLTVVFCKPFEGCRREFGRIIKKCGGRDITGVLEG